VDIKAGQLGTPDLGPCGRNGALYITTEVADGEHFPSQSVVYDEQRLLLCQFTVCMRTSGGHLSVVGLTNLMWNPN
jgi:hypothetical protein